MSFRRQRRLSDDPDVPDLDLRYMERLTNHIGPATVGAMLDDAMLELADRLSRIADLSADTNMDTVDQIADIAHSVTGVAGHVGLTALSIASADLSRAARAHATEGPGVIDDAVARVLEARDPAMDAIAAYRAAQKPQG